MTSVLTALRSEFMISPEIAYLNHGSYGACPRVVFEAARRYAEDAERNPNRFYPFETNSALLVRNSLAKIATYLHATPSNLVDVFNATHGMNIAARSLSLRAGDEVLISSHEYGAVQRMWKFISDETGAKIRILDIPLPFPGDEEIVQLFVNAMSPQVRALCVSHITPATACMTLPQSPLGFE